MRWTLWRRRTRGATYLAHKEAARQLIKQRLEFFSLQHGFSYKRIAIRDTRRSWGSCSEKGNLNFSYKLLFLPACLRDYVIVHELCHLRELNHSSRFWDEVARIMPDYKARMKELRMIERHQGTAVRTLRLIESDHRCAYCSANLV